MKFSCETCGTKYSIADEKIRGKVLKIRCKKCRNVILLREMVPRSSATAAREATGRPEAARARAGRSPRRPEPAAASSRGATRPAAATPRGATRPAARPEARASSGGRSASTAAARKPRAGARGKPIEHPWYLALRGKQTPPLRREEIAKKIRAREVKERTYAWNASLDAWTRLGELPHFAPDFAWLRQHAVGGAAGDSKKRVATRKKVAAQAGRKSAIDALDQIADLVREGQQAAPPPSARAEREAPTKQRAETAQRAEVAQRREAAQRKDVAQRAGAQRSPALVEHRAPEAGAGAEDFFFDPSSIESFVSSAPKIVKDQDPVDPGGAPADPSAAGFDPFAMAPDISNDMPRRESTRVFVAAAGLKNRARRQKIYAALAVLLVVGAISAVLLDAIGVIRIPVLHYYVQTVKVAAGGGEEEPTSLEEGAEGLPLTEEELKLVRQALLEGDNAKAEEVKRGARRRVRKQRDRSRAGPRKPAPRVDASPPSSERRGDTPTAAVELTAEERAALTELERSGLKSVTIRVKPGLKQIRLPRRHSGGLKHKQIAAVVAENQEGVKRCATQETKRGLDLPPALTVSMSINSDGQVTSARVEPPAHRDTALGRCLTKTIRNWRFPEFNGRTLDVEIPFKFTAVH